MGDGETREEVPMNVMNHQQAEREAELMQAKPRDHAEVDEHRSKGCLMRSRAIDVPEVAGHTRLETTRRYRLPSTLGS